VKKKFQSRVKFLYRGQVSTLAVLETTEANKGAKQYHERYPHAVGSNDLRLRLSRIVAEAAGETLPLRMRLWVSGDHLPVHANMEGQNMDLEGMERRLTRLEDIEAIKQLRPDIAKSATTITIRKESPRYSPRTASGRAPTLGPAEGTRKFANFSRDSRG